AGAELDQVTDLVDEPQAVATVVGAAADAPGQGVGDLAPVVHLAHDLLRGMPDLQHPAADGVADRVGGDLVRGQDQVDGAFPGEPGAPGGAGDQPPHRRP